LRDRSSVGPALQRKLEAGSGAVSRSSRVGLPVNSMAVNVTCAEAAPEGNQREAHRIGGRTDSRPTVAYAAGATVTAAESRL
jgi:hypothetical protein